MHNSIIYYYGFIINLSYYLEGEREIERERIYKDHTLINLVVIFFIAVEAFSSIWWNDGDILDYWQFALYFEPDAFYWINYSILRDKSGALFYIRKCSLKLNEINE